MDNRQLVEIVGTDKPCLGYKNPRDQRVLDAMLEVDRIEFLPDIEVDSVVLLNKVFKPFHRLVDDFMAAHKKLTEIREAQEDVDATFEQEYSIKAWEVLRHSEYLVRQGMQSKVPLKSLAYNDMVLPIGYDQTCSQPSLVGAMVDILELEPGIRVLEIGAGCGYHAAIVSHLIGEEGYLVTMEIIPKLAELAKKNLEAHFGQDFGKRIGLICGDGSKGWGAAAPFDRMYLTAGVSESFNSKILEEQLNKDDGILLYPEARGDLIGVFLRNGEREVIKSGKVGFVPLVGENA